MGTSYVLDAEIDRESNSFSFIFKGISKSEI